MPENLPPLDEAEVVRLVHEHIQTLFPKTCANCGQTFATYREYLHKTQPIGLPISYDLEMDDWQPMDTAGNHSLANCQCGSTLVLDSEGMPLSHIWQVLAWVKAEAQKRGVDMREILGYLRHQVRQRGFGDGS